MIFIGILKNIVKNVNYYISYIKWEEVKINDSYTA